MNRQEAYRLWLAEQRRGHDTPQEPPAPVVQQDMLAYAATVLGVPIDGPSADALSRLLQWVPTPAGSVEAQQVFLDDLAALLAVLPPMEPLHTSPPCPR